MIMAVLVITNARDDKGNFLYLGEKYLPEGDSIVEGD